MELPSEIAYYIGNKCKIIDNVGMSGAGAAVYLYDDMVLKVQEISIESENECKMLNWLAGKLPVPEIIAQINTNKSSYLLMSKYVRESACSNSIMAKLEYLAILLSQALNQMWEINCDNCPVNASLEDKLKQAEYNITHDLVDVNDCEPETFGSSLLQKLKT